MIVLALSLAHAGAVTTPPAEPALHSVRIIDMARGDLDQDGAIEVVQLGLGAESELHLHVVDDDGSTHSLDLGVIGDINGPRTNAVLTVSDVRDTGVPLAQVHVPGGEYCGSGDTTTYVAWTGAGAPTIALDTWTWSDAPYSSSREARFDAAAKTVEVIQTATDWSEEETSENHRSVETRTLAWNGRTFAAR
jgi:hypothetical protein